MMTEYVAWYGGILVKCEGKDGGVVVGLNSDWGAFTKCFLV